MNGNNKPFPFTYSNLVKGYIENYIRVTGLSGSGLTSLETSFGLKINFQQVSDYTVVNIYIPRHPELKGNTCGILGLWNDNSADDTQDPSGKVQSVDSVFSWTYGDSWCVSALGVTGIE